MPLIFKKEILPKGKIGIWKIEEPESFFIGKLQLYTDELAHFEKIKGKKRLEWLAVRYLLHQLSERDIRGMVIKDQYGKPRLDASPWNISISHTHNFAAVIAAPEPVGIDIQAIVGRIQLIADRFLNEEEKQIVASSKDTIRTLHVMWGIKESLFKIHGTGAIDFRKNLFVNAFDTAVSQGKADCRIERNGFRKECEASFELLDDNMLVFARLKDTAEENQIDEKNN
jgi:4'-phosphopantetheinyl transferase